MIPCSGDKELDYNRISCFMLLRSTGNQMPQQSQAESTCSFEEYWDSKICHQQPCINSSHQKASSTFFSGLGVQTGIIIQVKTAGMWWSQKKFMSISCLHFQDHQTDRHSWEGHVSSSRCGPETSPSHSKSPFSRTIWFKLDHFKGMWSWKGSKCTTNILPSSWQVLISKFYKLIQVAPTLPGGQLSWMSALASFFSKKVFFLYKPM